MRKKVLCWHCDRFLGWRTNRRYDVKDGTIQEGMGRSNPHRNFCSEGCRKNYHKILEAFDKINKRLDKLENKRK